MISEKLELLGKNCYTDIPGIITISSIPTSAELEYVGGEDFEATMLDKIFPKAIEEEGNWRNLLEIDFYWICRCLRITNYGPYHTTNAIYCRGCNTVNRGEYQVDLRNIECKPLPDNFDANNITVSRDEFLDFNQDVVLKMPTIQDKMNASKDNAFVDNVTGKRNNELARMCYMIKSIGTESKLTPLEIRLIIEKQMSSADYIILKNLVTELTDYGVRAGGTTTCPKCGDKNASYIALVDDRFLRPTLGDLRRWKSDRSSERGNKNVAGSKTTPVRKDN